MFRNSFLTVRYSHAVISELEKELFTFCKGADLNSGIVSDFMLSVRDRPNAVERKASNIVFLHRLAEMFCKDQVSWIDKRVAELPLAEMSTRVVTVVLGCCSSTETRTSVMNELISRPAEELREPRFIARLFQALVGFSPVPAQWIERINELVTLVPISDVQIHHLSPILRMRIAIPPPFLERAVQLVPFMGPKDAEGLLKIIQTSEKFYHSSSLIVELKKHILRANPRRGKKILKEIPPDAGPAKSSKTPYYSYVRKIDLR